MKGIDTNVLVRYLVGDDSRQAAAATRFIKRCTQQAPGFVNRIVLCELVWVLQRAYGYTREEITHVLDMLLRTAELQIEDQSAAWASLMHYAAGRCDFADALLALTNERAGCEKTATFDREAAALAHFQHLK